MARAKRQLSRRYRRLRCGSLLNASSMAKPVLISSAFLSRLRDCLAEHPRSTGASGASPDCLGLKRQSGSHRTLSRDGWPDFVFAFHDNEEIGPRMLAGIAKQTGLT